MLQRLRAYTKDKSWKYIFFGDYDYKYLCMPTIPFMTKKRAPPQFFARNAWLGICTAAIMGLQHCLSIVGGTIVPPILIGDLAANDPTLSEDEVVQLQQYLISACMIVSGIMTFVQVTGIPLWGQYRIGTRLLAISGVSFAAYGPFNTSMARLMNKGDTFKEAYGKCLATCCVAALLPMIVSFMPYRFIQRVFSPVVCGLVVMLIGISLCGSGIDNWGGGSYCASNQAGLFTAVDGGCTITGADGSVTNSTACYTMSEVLCSGNGDVYLPFGSGQYVGLGFSVFVMLIIVELFGSPFLRNTAVIISLMFGYFLSGVTRYHGQRFVTGEKIRIAPGGTFLWVHTFPLKFDGPSFLPMLIIFIITCFDSTGDAAATEEASFLATKGPAHVRRMRAVLLCDTASSVFSTLGTSMPLTNYSQNNGVISLTNVASRQAGWAGAAWILLFGIVGKIAGLITTIPNCVLGGMTTFLFANIIASGVHIMMGDHLTRRNRFIAACVLAIGVGVSIVPGWATNNLWPSDGLSAGVEGLRDAIINILSEGYAIGAIIGIILDTILPMETPNVVPEPEADTREESVTESMPSVLYAPREDFEPDYSKGSYEPGHDAVNFIKHLAHMEGEEQQKRDDDDLEPSVEGGAAYYAAPEAQIATKESKDGSIDLKSSGSDKL